MKKNDLVEFNFKGEKLQGLIKGIYENKRIVRVRVIKDKVLSWHEWIKLCDLNIVDGGVNSEQSYFDREINKGSRFKFYA